MRTHSIVIGLAGLTAALMMVSGCSDDPAHQAERQVQEKTAEAMDVFRYQGDAAGARQRLDWALSQRGSAVSRDAAGLAIGNLELADVRRQAADLELAKLPAQRELTGVQEQIRRIQKLQLQQMRVQHLIESGEQEIVELKVTLEGDGGSEPGLRNKLAQVQAQIRQLEEQQGHWEQKEAEADSQLVALEAQAEARFQEAKASSGAGRASLEQAGYAIRLKKKPYYFDKQEAVNQREVADNQIALIRPTEELLKTAIVQTAQKITDLENSTELAQLRTGRSQLAGQITAEQGVLRDQLSRFKQEVAGYRLAVDRTLDSLKAVFERYETIRSRDSQPTVLYKKAQIQSLTGSLTASRLLFEASVSLAVEGMIQTAGEDAVMKGLLQEGFLTVAEDQLLASAFESFDQADQTYEQALSEGRGLGSDDGKQYVLNATKSRLLNLHAKMKLADSLDRYELAEKAQAVLDEQIRKAGELGPSFTQSETARLLEKGLNYIPQMPYDSELYFEQIRADITAWRQAQGTAQQREEAARQALALIEQYEAQADEKLLPMLQPEKQAVQAAIERGFAEEAASPAPTPGPSPTDPNRP